MKQKIVLATKNPGKLKEFSELGQNENWIEFVLAPDEFNPVESAATFFENAKIKAIEAARLTGALALADDSGLVVEALNGKPGVHSARWCEGSDADRRQKLLDEMKKIPLDRRHASYFCAMVLVNPDLTVAFHTIRCWEGLIGFEEIGENGFGYDPLFVLPKYKLTVAQLSLKDKNKISHRAQAWQQVVKFLKNN